VDKNKIIEALKGAICLDGFSCPFGMYGRNRDGAWGCFAKYPDGQPGESHGCVAHQAARLLEEDEA